MHIEDYSNVYNYINLHFHSDASGYLRNTCPDKSKYADANKKAFLTLHETKTMKVLLKPSFRKKYGDLVILVIYDNNESAIIGFAPLTLTKREICILGWLSVENGECAELDRGYCHNYCPVDIFGNLLSYIKNHYYGSLISCWSYLSDLASGFSNEYRIGVIIPEKKIKISIPTQAKGLSINKLA